ncbi:NB-ARC domain-containing protein, partial [Moorena sp. SIO2C4]|uniref:NB-ARC domain-containing protein n=1 Tax=Moorena sp. SIO2C4 TaxID=2607824 RepID=UPI0013CC6413
MICTPEDSGKFAEKIGVYAASGAQVHIENQILQESHRAPIGVPFQAPPLPPYYVKRPEVSQRLKQILLSKETATAGTLVVSAIYGLGGIGKSTLAAALARDEEVQSHFTDGIFWATLGQNPDILSFLSTWIQQLGDYDFKPINIHSASLQLRTLLSDKKALLVVDDVWKTEDAQLFNFGGPGCQILVTTREAAIAKILKAIEYPLDVMQPWQAMKLLTEKLGHNLTDTETQEAEALAKEVGYLPLALELIAAQVAGGTSWNVLLQDMQQEVARLKGLDQPGARDAKDEASLKQLSLTASLNLSIKRLPAQQREDFIWLGILPDDVNITQAMIATLWDMDDERDAADELHYFQDKALLLSGIPGVDGTPTYRLHDLFHDLARNLLIAPPKPKRKGNLPGLGITLPAAHGTLLEKYRNLTDNNLWHTLSDDGYIYSHLTWHLEKAQKIDEIHQLLKEETPAGDNGWYWQCERQGNTANFVKDVSRAWAIAAANFTENSTESISLQCRYALITTSLNSLAGNIPPKLMAALLKNKIWTPAQALAYVRQNKDSRSQAESLKAISKYLPPSLLPEALDCATGIDHEFCRVYALVALAPQLPDVLLPKALDCARGLDHEYLRALALGALAPHLPDVLPEALDCARGISDEYSRARALVALAPDLPDVLPQALDCARRISDQHHRALALGDLAPYLPDVLPEALDCARGIWDQYHRANALVALASHLPDVLSEALDCARRISDKYYRALALGHLAPHLPDVLSEALDCARGIEFESSRALALIALAPHLPDVLPEALDCARGIEFENSRALALIGLVPHLPDVLSEALDCARRISDKYYRALALGHLAPHLPDVLSEALDCARGISFESSRADALIALAPHLPDVLPEALDCARGIEFENSRADALVALVPHLPDVLPEALDCARRISDENSRADALVALVPHLPDVLPEALDCARRISDENSRADALVAL